VRREIERLLSRAAAERATADQREALRAIADGMDTAAKADDDTNAIRALNDKIAADPRVDICMVPICDGVTMARKA